MSKPEVIGIIPAAGKATRLGKIPFSKELYPLEFEEKDGISVPKVVSSYLLDQMSDAGITSFHFVLRKGKWDIPNYYGGGKQFKRNICYQIADFSYGVPFSINQAYPFTKEKFVAIGFPDILMTPPGVYKSLVDKLISNDNTDIVLGLFPSPDPLKWDMVDIERNRIKNIYIKTEKGNHLKYTWVCAIWKPSFSAYLNHYINTLLSTKTEIELKKKESQLSDIFMSALKNDLSIDFIIFKNGRCMDIGTPERLKKASSFIQTDYS